MKKLLKVFFRPFFRTWCTALAMTVTVCILCRGFVGYFSAGDSKIELDYFDSLGMGLIILMLAYPLIHAVSSTMVISKNMNWLLLLPTRRRHIILAAAVMNIAFTFLSGVVVVIYLFALAASEHWEKLKSAAYQGADNFNFYKLFAEYFHDPNYLLTVGGILALSAFAFTPPLNDVIQQQVMSRSAKINYRKAGLLLFAFLPLLAFYHRFIAGDNFLGILLFGFLMIAISWGVTQQGLRLNKRDRRKLLAAYGAVYSLPYLIFGAWFWLTAPSLNAKQSLDLLSNGERVFASRVSDAAYRDMIYLDLWSNTLLQAIQYNEAHFKRSLADKDFAAMLRAKSKWCATKNVIDAWYGRPVGSETFRAYVDKVAEFSRTDPSSDCKVYPPRVFFSHLRTPEDVRYMMQSNFAPVARSGLVWARYFQYSDFRAVLATDGARLRGQYPAEFDKTLRVIASITSAEVARSPQAIKNEPAQLLETACALPDKKLWSKVFANKSLETCIRRWTIENRANMENLSFVEDNDWRNANSLTQQQVNYVEKLLDLSKPKS